MKGRDGMGTWLLQDVSLHQEFLACNKPPCPLTHPAPSSPFVIFSLKPDYINWLLMMSCGLDLRNLPPDYRKTF